MVKQRSPTIFIVSDGRGGTATQLVTAAALQFEGVRYRIVPEHRVRTPQRVQKIVKKAAELDAVIFYTLVSEQTRTMMQKASAEHLVAAVDILGPAFTALHDLFKSQRGSTPDLLYKQERERFDRMGAIDYTLKHDDGQRPGELSQADVVLVGVSRAAKSSTCFFLAYQGICAANVPLIPDIPPPPQLLCLPAEKVIGLKVNLGRLMIVRQARARDLGLATDASYTDERSVAREVRAANGLIEEMSWESIDASYLAVEEIASEVLRLRGLKGSND